ncbi:MAG: site-specific integrase [Desulfobacterales bacterium]|nr:site-specific integrase [Desulfobacterales bacterium]
MGTSWKPLKDAEGKSGVRYREHKTRRHGATPDKYFSFAYWWQGKTVTEGVGWASEGWTPNKCFELLGEIRRNQSRGKGPCTLTEMREEGQREREQARRDAEAREKLDVSFKDFFDDTYFPDAETRWKPETARKAEEHVNNWIDPVTGFTPIKDIKLSHVKKIRANLAREGRSPRTQQYVFRTFAMVWDAARDEGLVSGPSPTKSRSFRLPKVDNERQRYLTTDEETLLLAEVKVRGEAAYRMAILSVDTGMRFKEIACLAWGCVDLEEDSIKVLDSKGRDRYLPMTTRVKSLLQSMEAGKGKDLVFPTRKGTVQTHVPSSFTRGLADAKLNENIDDPKLKASFHSLRHTYASRMVQAGVDLYRVQRLLGHSTPVMTARYSKLADADLKEAVETMERAAEVKKGAKVIRLRKKA